MKHLPYGRQTVDDADVAAVVEVLRSDWLTTGPKVGEFERALADFCGVGEAVVVSNGTAALHAAMHALAIGPGDEVIVPAMTFAATANAVVYCGGKPVFVDVEPSTLSIDVDAAERAITAKTKAIVGVDYAGQPCAWDALRALALRKKLPLVADACHALGGDFAGKPVGSLADLSAFSFHPVKPITTGEGGAIATDNPELARRMRVFRNHGITTDHRQREKAGAWFYEMVELGYNYRLCDVQCVLGISQLKKLPAWMARRREIAARYDAEFARLDGIEPLARRANTGHAHHLYVVRVVGDRDGIFARLRTRGIGVNVHYIPVHLHPFYRERFGTKPGLCPVAEAAFKRILSLPIFPTMSNGDIEAVVGALAECIADSAAPVVAGGVAVAS